MTVFSCLVKGRTENPNLDKKVVHDLTKKKPSSPAATLRDGIIPTVRLSLWVMMQKRAPRAVLTTSPLIVICSLHSGISSSTPSIFSEPLINGSDIPAAEDTTSVPMEFPINQSPFILSSKIQLYQIIIITKIAFSYHQPIIPGSRYESMTNYYVGT